MARTRVVIVVALLVLGVAGAAAFAFGVGPAPGGGDDAEMDDFPTETTTDGSDGGDGATGGDGSTADDTPPFTFAIDRIEECGTTCRDVTATIYNEQNRSAEDVVVYTQIYAGNSTAEDDRIWRGKQEIGAMDANGSETRTQRVSLSYGDAYSVEQNDGWITVVTTVQSADRTVTFERQRDVT